MKPQTPRRPDEIALLTGRLRDSPYPSGIGLPGSGEKFTTDGHVQIWKGNTFIFHVERPSPAFTGLMSLQETMKRSEFGTLFTWLPAESFHMTLFQGMSPGPEGSADWPAGVPTDAPRDAVTAAIAERIAGITLPRPRVAHHALYAGHSLTMSGRDAEAEDQLRAARRLLRDKTGISPPGFDSYVFHITLGYLVQWITEDTATALCAFAREAYAGFAKTHPDIPLLPCAFCNFDSMHHFEPAHIC